MSLYAVNPDFFDVDFDGDGKPDVFRTEGGELVVRSDGRELLRIPRTNTDGTFRTQFALRHDFGKPRLIIFDAHYPVQRMAVFAAVGEKMVQVEATAYDLKVLKALATGDDGGSRLQWGLYSVVRIPALLLALFIVGTWLSMSRVIVYRDIQEK